MIKRLIISIILIGVSQLIISQEVNFYRDYISNCFYNINPAAAGYEESFVSQISLTKKMIGLKDAPTMQILSNSIKLGGEGFYDDNMFLNRPIIDIADKVGIGLTVFNETNGPARSSGILFAYAYYISLEKGKLALGISGSLSQYQVNSAEFKPIDNNDPILYTENSKILTNFNSGILYLNKGLTIGVSATELIKNESNINPTTSLIVHAGYKQKFYDYLYLEPSSTLFYSVYYKSIADINLRLYYKSHNWIMLTVRDNRSLRLGLGLRILDGLQVIYFYDKNSKESSDMIFSSHTVSIRANIEAFIPN